MITGKEPALLVAAFGFCMAWIMIKALETGVFYNYEIRGIFYFLSIIFFTSMALAAYKEYNKL